MPRKGSTKKSTFTRKRKRVEDPAHPDNRQAVIDGNRIVSVPEIVEDIKVEEKEGDADRKIKVKRHTKAKSKEIPRDQDIRASFPVFDNKMMHLATQAGDIANRVIICPDDKIAWRFARYFDNPSEVIEVVSTRHFRTYTGLFHGVPISVIASGMGGPMVDFTMREAKFCIGQDSPMAVVRFGACCSISDCAEGDVIVATDGSFNVQTDFVNRQEKKEKGTPYKISDLVPSDPDLSSHLVDALKDVLVSEDMCHSGILGTSDSFYGSQARTDYLFNDENENLLNQILKKYPKCKSLDMETFNVIATAKMAKRDDVYASAVAYSVLNRMHRKKESKLVKDQVGYAIFKALARFDFPEGEPFSTVEMIKRIKFGSS